MRSDARVSACLAFLETAHAWELEDAAWLNALAEAAAGVWGRPRWAVAYTYDASSGADLRYGRPQFWNSTPMVEAMFATGLDRHTTRRENVQMFRSITVGFAKPARGMDEIAAQTFAELQTQDFFGINGLDSSGLGCFVGIGAERTALSAEELVIFHRLAAHLSSAYRCRRRLRALEAPATEAVEGAEALLDPSGRVVEARGPAESKDARESLQDATRAIQHVRRRASRDEPTARWRPRVSGRWTLVDVANRGARFIAARENQTSPRGLDALTDREQQVVASAVAGRTTKEIAYELGISYATARVLLARSYSRLGVRTRKELFELPSIRVLRGVDD